MRPAVKPFDVADLKTYTCQDCQQLFRIGGGNAARRKYCRRCMRIYFDAGNNHKWLHNHPWSYE